MLNQPRYAYIQSQVLDTFRKVPDDIRTFPFNIKAAFKTMQNCKVSSYQNFAREFNVTVEDVINMCESFTGCTHYKQECDKYIVLYNASTKNYNVSGRQRWTLGHELGHVVLKHPLISLQGLLAEGGREGKNQVVESEADFFAAQMLAPLPLFEKLQIKSSLDVERVFGLSAQASINRFDQYLKWKAQKIKKAFDNDIVRLFSTFINSQ